MYVKILILLVIFVCVGITEIVPLAKQKKKKDLVVYCIFFGSAFILSFLYTIGVPIPQVSKGLNAIIDAIFQTNLN